jgi:regulator of sirC expression with transglutaminase-like and TPR domain
LSLETESNESLQHRFQNACDSEHAEFELALLVAEAIDEGLDHQHTRQIFSELISPLSLQAQDGPKALLEWFADSGFGVTERAEPVGLQHSNLQWVIQHRQGIPISLAVLLIEGARYCGFESHGVNYPGHFLVSIQGQLFDPLSMQPVELDKLQGAQLDDEHVPDLMQQATPQMVGLRMLNNVKGFYLNRREWVRALDIIDYQLAIAGSDRSLSGSLHYERGEYWAQLGAHTAAAQAFQVCAETCPHKQLATKASARAAELGRHTDTLH